MSMKIDKQDFRTPAYGSFERAIDSANSWLSANQIDVISVETLTEVMSGESRKDIGLRIRFRTESELA